MALGFVNPGSGNIRGEAELGRRRGEQLALQEWPEGLDQGHPRKEGNVIWVGSSALPHGRAGALGVTLWNARALSKKEGTQVLLNSTKRDGIMGSFQRITPLALNSKLPQ